MASEKIIHVDDSSFDQQVLGTDTPVLLDLWADWCVGTEDLLVESRRST